MIIKGTSCYANAKSGNLVSITGDVEMLGGFMAMHIRKCLQDYIYGNTTIKIPII